MRNRRPWRPGAVDICDGVGGDRSLIEMDARGRIELLGGLRVQAPGGGGDSCITRFVTRKFADLLAYLAFYRERAHLREELAALLWPKSAPAAGRCHLRVALTSLRHQLEPAGAAAVAGGAFLGTRTTIQLNPAAWITDVALFESACCLADRASDVTAEALHLEAAVAAYGGELLPGCCEEWVLPQRQRLADECLRVLGRLAALRERIGDLPGALQCAHKAVAADPLREETCFELIRLLLAAGEPGAARRRYQELEQRLREELDMAPALELHALIRKACHGAEEQRSDDPHPLRVAPAPAAGDQALPLSCPFVSHYPCRKDDLPVPASSAAVDAGGSLPASFTRFFGREQEVAALCALLVSPPALIEAQWTRKGGEREPAGAPLSTDLPRALCVSSEAGGESSYSMPARLVTITGPGGIGKTRLAVEVAGQIRERVGDAVWFVPLVDLAPAAHVREPEADAGCRIIDLLLEVLRLPRSPDLGSMEQLASFLRARPSLLVLDNFEHLVEEGALLVRQLLERVPALTTLITSRRRLDLVGECEFPLGPLPVPVESPGTHEVGRVPTEWVARVERPTKACPTHASTLNSQLSTLTACPSVRLFLDRAQAVRPDFRLTQANAAAIARLCARLEGIPLALELAAARVWVLSPAQMLERLPGTHETGTHEAVGGRFELLASRRRDLASRHRSLRSTLAWSYRLLAPEVQRFVARLSVFRGGWTLEAAEAVCGDCGLRIVDFGFPTRSKSPEGETLLGSQIHHPPSTIHKAFDLLDQLREASLILAEPAADGTELRYRMLETVREYAAEQLSPEERAAVEYHHTAYYLALAERDETDPRSMKQQERFVRLECERHNLGAALEWCVRSGVQASGTHEVGGRSGVQEDHGTQPERLLPVEIGFRLARALLKFWHTRGYFLEGRQRLGALLAHPGAAALPAAQARALTDAGYLAYMQNDAVPAAPLLEESVARFRELGDQPGLALALNNLALAAADPAARAALYEESLALFRETGDQDRIANALFNLATVAHAQGDRVRARALAAESRDSYQARGDQNGIALATTLLGELALEEEHREEGRPLLEEALARFREIANRPRMRDCLAALARVARAEGNAERARASFTEALQLSREMGQRVHCADGLRELGELELQAGNVSAARPLLEEALGLCRELGRDSEAAACQELLQSV